jgi:hypothetical protein
VKSAHRNPEKGSLVLVVLCLLAVLGVALASYLTVSNQSMKLSNRSFQTQVSAQLAEMGLEEALRAINTNNFDDWTSGTAPNQTSADWTLSGNTASCTITLPATKYGSSGVAGVVRIRVDNYNAYNLASTWSSSTSYRVNDLVGYGGVWYRCVQAHSNQTPSALGNLAYWVPAPIPWTWRANFSYKLYDMVNYNGVWYRCNLAHTSGASWSATNWTSIGSIKVYSAADTNSVGNIVYNPDATTWYRCTAAGTPGTLSGTAQISWQYTAATTYSYNDVVCYYTGSSYTWYRYINATASSNKTPTLNPTYWENALTGTMWTWGSTINYNIGDAVYRSGSFYRCIRAHSNQGPPNATYWSTSPLLSPVWDPGRQYSANDTVFYNGLWYWCRSSNNGQVPPTASPYYDTYWASTADTTRQWSAATAYTTSSYVNYGGVWYHCILAHTNITPNNATYWTALGAPVIYAEGAATLPDSTATVKTQLRAPATPAPIFPNAVAGSTKLTISGGGTVDSYDGSINAISTAGSATAKAYGGANIGYSATLAGGDTASTALSVSSTTVKGYYAAPSSSTSPYFPLFSVGASASLTNSDLTVTSPHATAASVDQTRVSRSPFIPQFDPLPSGGLSAAFTASSLSDGTALPVPGSTNNTFNLGTPGATTPSIYYYNGSLTIASASPIGTLNINGPVILYIIGNLRTNTGGTIVIYSSGSAEIHISGRLRIENGSNGFINRTTDPKNLLVICADTSSNTQYYSDTTNPFYGTIYMPGTTVAGGLSVTTGVTMYGALSAKNITYSAEATLHYDTSLRYKTFLGISAPLIISQWRELTDLNERAVLP